MNEWVPVAAGAESNHPEAKLNERGLVTFALSLTERGDDNP